MRHGPLLVRERLGFKFLFECFLQPPEALESRAPSAFEGPLKHVALGFQRAMQGNGGGQLVVEEDDLRRLGGFLDLVHDLERQLRGGCVGQGLDLEAEAAVDVDFPGGSLDRRLDAGFF